MSAKENTNDILECPFVMQRKFLQHQHGYPNTRAVDVLLIQRIKRQVPNVTIGIVQHSHNPGTRSRITRPDCARVTGLCDRRQLCVSKSINNVFETTAALTFDQQPSHSRRLIAINESFKGAIHIPLVHLILVLAAKSVPWLIWNLPEQLLQLSHALGQRFCTDRRSHLAQ